MLAYNGDVVGEDVKEDRATSWACFEAAAVLGNEEARRERDRVGQELTPAQLEKAHLRAAAFFIDGTMAPKNVARARAELETDVKSKPSTATVLLGMTYLDPALETPNADKAIEYCSTAEKAGIRNAAHCLGKAYEMKGDDKSAFKHFLLAATDGKTSAMINVAKRYHDGRGTKANNIMAAAWAHNAGGYDEAPELYSTIMANLAPNQIKDVQKKSAQLRESIRGLPY